MDVILVENVKIKKLRDQVLRPNFQGEACYVFIILPSPYCLSFNCFFEIEFYDEIEY